jgi:hypothetical protein
METEMIYWGIAGYTMMYATPVFVGIWLLLRSFIYFKKHDREKDMFSDKWGVLSIVTFLLAIILCALGLNLLSWLLRTVFV